MNWLKQNVAVLGVLILVLAIVLVPEYEPDEICHVGSAGWVRYQEVEALLDVCEGNCPLQVEEYNRLGTRLGSCYMETRP